MELLLLAADRFRRQRRASICRAPGNSGTLVGIVRSLAERRVAGSRFSSTVSSRKDVAALRHIGDAAARAAHQGRSGLDIGAFPPDRAGRHRMLADERAQQAGLADAVAPEHAGHLAGLGVQRDGAQRWAAP